jgi:hypothetical protein
MTTKATDGTVPGTDTTAAAADPVTAKLAELGVSAEVAGKIKTDLGAETVDDLSGLTEEDLIGAGMKKLAARKVVTALVKPKVATTESASATGPVSAISFNDILPVVPSDSSWLEALKAGGVLKVNESTVISAIRAALAYRAGLFGIPETLAKLMENFADENAEQVSPEFFKIRKEMTRRSYAEIFAAIDGLEGSFVTEKRKNQLFERIDTYLWPAITGFNGGLKSWQEAWMQGAGNPAMMMSAMMMSSGGPSMMPPGMMQPPETNALRDNADAVADAINKVFAGTGVQIAAALAYDATRVKETLENPSLPAMIGVANRDQMLRKLGVAVSATYPRMEINLTRFVLAIMKVKDQPAGNEEVAYFSSLCMLGSQIPWDQLGEGTSGRPSGIGRGATRSSL